MPLNEDDKAELVAYLDGELDEQATQAVEAKLATDADARAELETLKQTWGMLDYLPKANPSVNFTNRTMERLSLEKVGATPTILPVSPSKSLPVPPQPSPRWSALVWGGAAAVAVIVGYWASSFLFVWMYPPDPTAQEAEEALIRYLRIVEKWRYYESVDDRKFIEELSQPDLFGEEPS